MEKWGYSDRNGMIADINFMNKDKIENKQYFPVICPDCGNKAGHLYEHRYEVGKDAGGLWVWCSACHDYEHYRARLPKWWKNPDFISSASYVISRIIWKSIKMILING